jgi:hypothetical protein
MCAFVASPCKMVPTSMSPKFGFCFIFVATLTDQPTTSPPERWMSQAPSLGQRRAQARGGDAPRHPPSAATAQWTDLFQKAVRIDHCKLERHRTHRPARDPQ